jgi:hypothetical protein
MRNKELDPNTVKIYLQCSSALTVNILKKFISMKKDGIESLDFVDVMYDDKPLKEELTLLDIAYMFAWRRTAPMRLFYRINNKLSEKSSNNDKISDRNETNKNTVEILLEKENAIDNNDIDSNMNVSTNKQVLGQIDNRMNEIINKQDPKCEEKKQPEKIFIHENNENRNFTFFINNIF